MLLNNGSFTANDATMNVVGNWTNSGLTFTPNTSIVKFQGTASTTITSGGQSFFKVNIERNASATTTTVLDNMNVLDELKIVTGTLIVNQDVVGNAEKVDVSTTGRLTLKAVTTGTKGGELRVNP
jgi:hypothetical protein